MVSARTTRRSVLRTTGGVLAARWLASDVVGQDATDAEAWPQYGYDEANTGYAPGNTGPNRRIGAEWTALTGDLVRSSPTVADGSVFVGSDDGLVYAMNATDGSRRWDVDIGNIVRSTPAVADGTVLVGSHDGSVYALDATDGSRDWVFETGGWVTSSPVIVDGTVFVGSYDDSVYALDATDGTTVWSFETGGSVRSSPAIVGGIVYVGSDDGRVYALDAGTGSEEWTFETGDSVGSSPAIAGGVVYVGSDDGRVYALDAGTGSKEWTFETGDVVTTSPAIADGTLYVGGWDRTVYALDAAEGTTVWTFETGDVVDSSPSIVEDTVYVGSGDGNVYAFDATSGSREWVYEAGDRVLTAPAVADGAVYVGSNAGLVLALRGGHVRTETTDETTTISTVETPTQAPTRTSTRTPTPSSPDTPTSTGTAGTGVTDDEDIGVLPVALGLLGLGGGGGAALWWLRGRSRDGDPDDRGRAPVDADGHASPDRSSNGSGGRRATSASRAEDSPSDDVAAAIADRIDRGDALQERAADHRTGGEYDSALEDYAAAREAYESAREKATAGSAVDTAAIEMKLERIDADRRDVRRRQLESDLDTLRARMDRADRLATRGDLEPARGIFKMIDGPLEAIASPIADHGFDDLREELQSLDGRRADRLADSAAELKDRAIPDEVPRAPDVAVDFDALTDEEPIGSGGNADVTSAVLPTPDGSPRLAIKKPRMAGTLHTERVERLLEEAETWSKLDDHDNVVGVVDWGSDPLPWIAMEYMDGGHLGERSGGMTVPQALWTAITITKGIRHAHRRGVAHLDLKPENVLFRSIEEGWDVPKVGDWGLSRRLLDESGSIEGLTPQSAAPEQFDDSYGAADHVTDIYQLGVVFYELFTGHLPFEGEPMAVMRSVLSERPKPPSEVADVPEGLDDVLLTALARQKEDRYEDIVYLRDELQDLFDDW